MKHQMAPFTVEYGNPCGCAAGLYTHGCDRYDDTSTNLTPMHVLLPNAGYTQTREISRWALRNSKSPNPPIPSQKWLDISNHINPSCYMYFNPFQSISISQHLSLSPWSPGHMSAPRGRAHGWWCQQRPEDPDGLDVPRNGWPLTKKLFFDKTYPDWQKLHALLHPLRLACFFDLGLRRVPLKVDF